MSVTRFSTSNASDILKLEGNDPVDTWFKQSIVKDPLISLTKASDRPVQWIQFLKALDQPDLQGWPLLSPVKVQVQKCDKCSRKFLSSINCRRHVRVHHRLKTLDKDTGKSRELLGSFWNKLSAEEAKKIVSFKDLTFEGVPGAAIIKNLGSLNFRTGFSPLPEACDRAGAVLLDIIQARPSMFPLSAEELFSILDGASEKTFLSGPALSMQKYIFDGEAAKIVLEAKNLVACTSFFLELRLIKAWIADRDAEALRCQKLLVEEEEAAQRKQAERLEKKRQKKLKQKARDSRVEVERDHQSEKLDSPKGGLSVESSGNVAVLVSEMVILDEAADEAASSPEISEHPQDAEEVDFKAQAGLGFNFIDPGISENIKQQHLQGDSHQKSGNGRWKMTSRLYGSSRGFYGDAYPQAPRTKVDQCQGINNIQGSRTVNTNEVKSWKRKPENNEIVKFRVPDEAFPQVSHSKKHEVLIGSIPVTIQSCNNLQVHELEGQDSGQARAEYSLSSRNISEKIFKDENIQLLPNPEPHQSYDKVDDCQSLAAESCLPASAPGNGVSLLAAEAKGSGNFFFSSRIARDFLAQRWKDAISADHVKLVLLPESEPETLRETQNDPQEILDCEQLSIRTADGVAVTSLYSGNDKASFGVIRGADL